MNSDLKMLVYNENGTEKYEDVLREAGFTSIQTATSEEEAKSKLSETEVIFCWKFPTHLLSLSDANSVRWIQSMGAGVDDLVYDENIPENILLTRVVDQFGGKISEYVFAYLLFISQDISRTREAQKQRRWEAFLPDFLAGKTIGIAGLGSIGSELVRKARTFDMEVHGLSFSGKNASLVDRHFFASDWLSFVKDLDVLVLTLPLTEETNQIVSTDILENMKKNSVLVNVGRGGLISENDLVFVLQSGHLNAAILDVFTVEPLPLESELWSLSNVYITPHIAGPSLAEDVGNFFVDNLKQYIINKPLIGLIQRNKGF